MRTEIDKDFRIERHKEYTIIWPFRTYADEEDKEEKKTDGCFKWFIWLFILFCYCLLWLVFYVKRDLFFA